MLIVSNIDVCKGLHHKMMGSQHLVDDWINFHNGSFCFVYTNWRNVTTTNGTHKASVDENKWNVV